MKLEQFLQVHLTLLFFVIPIHSFSIDAKDKIAVESGTQVVSDKKVYVPLGWPSTISCDSASKLRDINIEKSVNLEWTIRFANGTVFVLEQGANFRKTYDMVPGALNINPVTREIDGSVIECTIVRPGNTTLIGRNRVEVQDCKPQPPEDQKAYNLHNPCAYGMCQLVDRNTSVECLCFKQYTGRHCDIRKPYSWIFDVVPYVMTIIVLVLHFIVTSTVSLMNDDRKQVKIMGIAELSGYPDRESFNLSNLYPFTKKLRRCNFADLDDEDGSKEKRYKKIQKKYRKLKEKKGVANVHSETSQGSSKTQSLGLSSTIGDLPKTGTSTGTITTTTATTTTTGSRSVSTGPSTTTSGGQPGSTMNKVSTSASGGTTGPSTRTDLTGGYQKAPTKRTNKKKQQQQPQQPKQTAPAPVKSAEKLETIPELKGYMTDDTISASML